MRLEKQSGLNHSHGEHSCWYLKSDDNPLKGLKQESYKIRFAFKKISSASCEMIGESKNGYEKTTSLRLLQQLVLGCVAFTRALFTH